MTALLKEMPSHIVQGDDDFTYKVFYRACGFVLEIGVKPPSELGFGTMVWDAALGLCQYFEEQRMRFSQRKVIELGAGTGILGILTVLLGGDVTITDKPELLKRIERNVSVNIPSSCRPRVKVCALSWGDDHTLFPSDYDFILGGDIMYSRASVPLILKTLQHLSNERTIIYFASTMWINRNLISSGYQTLSQYFDSDLVYRNKDKYVNVYRMTKKTPSDGDRVVP
ncbi:EEF1A lysine methyltransferase 3-like [Heptranchias perlo]|uniref:EEF1A lysine methyltransferase 3-like n=1 Tax=Heptranchias perlo TaxID=212740 RepID=UPI00355ABB4F